MVSAPIEQVCLILRSAAANSSEGGKGVGSTVHIKLVVPVFVPSDGSEAEIERLLLKAPPKATLRVGRRGGCDVQLQHSAVSGNHCSLVVARVVERSLLQGSASEFTSPLPTTAKTTKSSEDERGSDAHVAVAASTQGTGRGMVPLPQENVCGAAPQPRTACYIIDHSTNGVWVNNFRIGRRTPVPIRDRQSVVSLGRGRSLEAAPGASEFVDIFTFTTEMVVLSQATPLALAHSDALPSGVCAATGRESAAVILKSDMPTSEFEEDKPTPEAVVGPVNARSLAPPNGDAKPEGQCGDCCDRNGVRSESYCGTSLPGNPNDDFERCLTHQYSKPRSDSIRVDNVTKDDASLATPESWSFRTPLRAQGPSGASRPDSSTPATSPRPSGYTLNESADSTVSTTDKDGDSNMGTPTLGVKSYSDTPQHQLVVFGPMLPGYSEAALSRGSRDSSGGRSLDQFSGSRGPDSGTLPLARPGGFSRALAPSAGRVVLSDDAVESKSLMLTATGASNYCSSQASSVSMLGLGSNGVPPGGSTVSTGPRANWRLADLVRRLQRDNACKDQEISDVAAELERSEQRRAGVEAELQELRCAAQRHQANSTSLEGKLADSLRVVEQWRGNAEDAEARSSLLNRRLETALQRAKQLKSENESLTAESRQHQVHLQELALRLSQTNSLLEDSNERANELESQLEQLRRACSRAESERNEALESLEATHHDATTLRERLAAAETNLAQFSTRDEQAERMRNCLEARLEQLEKARLATVNDAAACKRLINAQRSLAAHVMELQHTAYVLTRHLATRPEEKGADGRCWSVDGGGWQSRAGVERIDSPGSRPRASDATDCTFEEDSSTPLASVDPTQWRGVCRRASEPGLSQPSAALLSTTALGADVSGRAALLQFLATSPSQAAPESGTTAGFACLHRRPAPNPAEVLFEHKIDSTENTPTLDRVTHTPSPRTTNKLNLLGGIRNSTVSTSSSGSDGVAPDGRRKRLRADRENTAAASCHLTGSNHLPPVANLDPSSPESTAAAVNSSPRADGLDDAALTPPPQKQVQSLENGTAVGGFCPRQGGDTAAARC